MTGTDTSKPFYLHVGFLCKNRPKSHQFSSFMGIMIPTETILGETVSPYLVDLNDYQTELVKTMSKSWAIARENMVCSAETKDAI